MFKKANQRQNKSFCVGEELSPSAQLKQQWSKVIESFCVSVCQPLPPFSPNNNPGRLQQTPVFFFFFTLVNHLPQNWLITSASWNYWWCNALHAFHIRGSETGEKREKKQKHSQNTYPWKPWKFLIFFFHIIIQYRSLSGDVIPAVTVTSSHSKKVQS